MTCAGGQIGDKNQYHYYDDRMTVDMVSSLIYRSLVQMTGGGRATRTHHRGPSKKAKIADEKARLWGKRPHA